ncbi:GbsR/MarR family transcriptional regulator [Microbacterium sp. No. 7]|uniref:GbsR/MarR family transcriptional regulator n=1 Tax=Microbacterium sp. No. 7 TaxID=1714373 RepID=UPI0006ED473F|nr:hypothetical protein [Microbacterium sp. No. 7]ALJ20877.1 hypothetical protein AOA12_13570 [Microbacterium sp. No. 7]
MITRGESGSPVLLLSGAGNDNVDAVADFFAQEGVPLIPGRVIGWLLISDPPEQSAADLSRVLDVSRSSISSATRPLMPSGLDLLGDAAPARRTRLENVAELYRFLETELPAMWERWERRPNAAGGSGR